MENIYYRLLPKEDRRKLIGELVESSSNPTGFAVEMGDKRTTRATYHYFVLQNGAGIVSSEEDNLIIMGVRNSEHAQETRNLLSQIGNIPRDKFIPVEAE